MKPSNPRLTRAALRLERALDELDQSIIDRNVLEKQLEQSWKKLSTLMKALDRRWDQADHSTFRKLRAKHTARQKALTRAQTACSGARQNYHEQRDSYDAARQSLSRQMLDMSGDLDLLHRCQGALNRVLGDVVDRLKSDAGGKNAGPAYNVRDGAYDYIPYGVPDFLVLLVRLDRLLADDADYAANDRRYRPVSFLEVGCGPGRNLMIARKSNLVDLAQVAGFDINPDTVALGKRAFGLTEGLLVADAMSFDYSAWDVVFSFRPFADIHLQRQLEAHIAGSMRRSAYLLAPLSQDLGLCRELTPTGASPDIWKKTGHGGLGKA